MPSIVILDTEVKLLAGGYLSVCLKVKGVGTDTGQSSATPYQQIAEQLKKQDHGSIKSMIGLSGGLHEGDFEICVVLIPGSNHTAFTQLLTRLANELIDGAGKDTAGQHSNDPSAMAPS